jgi:hypothetical protein
MLKRKATKYVRVQTFLVYFTVNFDGYSISLIFLLQVLWFGDSY